MTSIKQSLLQHSSDALIVMRQDRQEGKELLFEKKLSVKKTIMISSRAVKPHPHREKPLGLALACHSQRKPGISMDTLGIVASCICLLHCMALPVLLAIVPFAGGQLFEADWTHKVLALFVLTFALWATLPAYFKHRRLSVLFSIAAGLALVFFATFVSEPLLGAEWELPLITAGNLIVVLTHFRNRSLLCACDH